MGSQFGERVKAIRTAANLSLAQFGDRIGVSKGVVAQWENGAIDMCNTTALFAISEKFGVDPHFLATGKSSRKRDTADIPDRHLELIRAYGRLPPDVRGVIRALIETFSRVEFDVKSKTGPVRIPPIKPDQD